MQGRICGKVYPNGRFAVWRERGYVEPKFRTKEEDWEKNHNDYLRHLRSKNERGGVREGGWDDFPSNQEMPVLPGLGDEATDGHGPGRLGSSKLSKSNKNGRARGELGISRREKRLLANGTFLMEKRPDVVNCVGMVTLTFPSLPREDWDRVGERWTQGMNLLRMKLRRRLVERGVEPWFCGCIEIQEKRLARTGEPSLHLHIATPLKDASGQWLFSIPEWVELWRGCWAPSIGGTGGWGSQCVDVAPARKSIGAYLGKYVSKGVSAVDELVRVTGGWHPSSWAFCSAELRSAIEAHTSYGNEIGEFLRKSIKDEPEMFQFVSEVRLPPRSDNPDDKGAVIACYGQSKIYSY